MSVDMLPVPGCKALVIVKLFVMTIARRQFSSLETWIKAPSSSAEAIFFISLRNFYVNFLESINGLLNEVSRFHLFEYEDIVRPRNVINFWWIDSKLNIFSKEQHLSGSNGTIERARHTNSSNLSYVDFFLFLERKKCYFERSIRRDNRQTAN